MAPDHSDLDTLHGRFQKRVREVPDHTALEYEGRSVSYPELNRQANRIAHHLRQTSGVRADDRVAVLVRDPLDMIIGVIGVLKAGGAYVPLDPDNPPTVTAQILDDAAPKAVLLDSSSAAGVAYFGGDLFVTDVMSASLSTPDTDPEPLSGPSDLAYVIYTSGTTGVPKGVAVEHRSIVNTVAWRNAYYGFRPRNVALAIPRPSFDSAVEDIFCMLTAGGTLLLPERGRITDRRYLVDLVERRKVSHFLVTPALYKRILPGLDAKVGASLRTITIAGEAFTPGLVHEHYRRLPHVKLVNEYGPSENAVCSTAHPLGPTDRSVFIGRPIDNTDAFVVGEDGEPVGPGGIGELYLAGAGLARGYLGNPELTDEKFTTGRSPAMGETRVYRSGDLVRVCADGNLQFVGRRDRQVKIRGQRVELDHVAECLAGDPAVEDVFVTHRAVRSAQPQLVAFVVGPADTDVERLHATARESLPAYMAPALIVPVEAIPLTGHGKVDEQALLAACAGPAGEGAEPTSLSEVEAALRSIWQLLFPAARIGVDDDFFELGGDSLTVMDLVAQVNDGLGIGMDSADVYNGRTVRDLATLIQQRQEQMVGAS